MILNNTLTTGGGARSGSTNLGSHRIMDIRLLNQNTQEIQIIIAR